ncbi:MAG: HgcAB-associated protein [Methanomicrobiales archaeon]
MTKNPPGQSCDADSNPVTCQVEAVLSIDSRGQVVIPKEVRRRANIRDGDKLALVSWMNKDEVCCLALIRTDNLSSEVSGVMRSLLADND